MAEYNANDVAKYIINYAIEKENPITNLHLQKILYFVWIDFYKATKEHLFDESIEAWQYGPVVPKVYNEYFIFSSFQLKFKQDEIIQNDERLNGFIDKYYKQTVSDLVKKSHEKGKSWDKNYKINCKNTIPFKDIEKFDC